MDDPDAWVFGISDDLYTELDRVYATDEYHFYVYPIVSVGETWFDQITNNRGLELLSATPYADGVVGLYYKPKES